MQAETLAPAVAGSSTGPAVQQPAALCQSVTPCSSEDAGDRSVHVPTVCDRKTAQEAAVTEQIDGWNKSVTGAWIKQESAPGPPVNAAVHGSDNISDVSSVSEQLMQSGHAHNLVLNINNKQPKVMQRQAAATPPQKVGDWAQDARGDTASRPTSPGYCSIPVLWKNCVNKVLCIDFWRCVRCDG